MGADILRKSSSRIIGSVVASVLSVRFWKREVLFKWTSDPFDQPKIHGNNTCINLL